VVEAADQAGGAFHLNAEEFFSFGPIAADEDEVEALAIPEGFGDSEAEAGGFVGEGEFGKLSTTLGVEFLSPGSLSLRRWEALGRRAAFWHGVEKQKAQAGSLRLFLCLFLWD
jgi:hypothetical protein